MSAKGEKYKSKKQMLRHEKGESKRERMMEYGSEKGGMKGNGCMGRKPCK